MANFHVDSSGNMWSGITSTTYSSTAPFYVTSAGVLKASAGTFGGITINAGDIQANYTAGSLGFKIDNSGNAEFNSIKVRLDSAGSSSESTVSNAVMGIGNARIYENASSLYLRSGKVVVQDSDGGSELSPSLTFSTSFDDPGFYAENDFTNTQAKLFWSSGTNNIIHSESDYDTLYIDAANIAIGTDTGSANEFIGKNSSGTLGWYSVSSGSHNHDTVYYTETEVDTLFTDHLANEDHISLVSPTSSLNGYATTAARSDHDHTESDITNIGTHSHSGYISSTDLSNHAGNSTAHGTFDNYNYWNLVLNGSAQIYSGNSVSFTGGTNTSAVRTGTSIRYDVSFPSLSIANTTSNNAAYAFVTAVSGHQITRTNTSSSTLSAAGWSVNSSGGYVGAPGVGATVWYTSLNSTSDETLKTDITDLTYGLDWINGLTPISYRFQTRTVYVCENDLSPTEYPNADDICLHCQSQNEIDTNYYNELVEEFNNENLLEEPIEPTLLTTGLVSKEVYWGNTKENWGFSAQEIESSLPVDPDLQIVEDVERPDGGTMKVLEYNQMIAPLVKAVQELSTQVSDLTARIEALEG